MNYVTTFVTEKRLLYTVLRVINSRADKLIDCALFDKNTKIGTDVL